MFGIYIVCEFACRIVTYAKELVSICICYSIGEWFNTPLSSFITSTYGQCVLTVESCTVPSNLLY